MDEVEGEETRLLVKWAGAGYSECTYETVADLDNAGQVRGGGKNASLGLGMSSGTPDTISDCSTIRVFGVFFPMIGGISSYHPAPGEATHKSPAHERPRRCI